MLFCILYHVILAYLTISINEGADRNLDRHPLNVKIYWNNQFLALLQYIFQISYL